jgi:biopolymer transport protein ExbB
MRQNNRKKVPAGRGGGVLFLLVLVATLTCASTVQAWWDEKWQYRTKVGFDTSVAGADVQENLDEVPILVRLHSGNFNFANAKSNGEDIRFVSSDDKGVLKHHIELFDSIDEIALLWVKVPRLSGDTNLEFLWMYYGFEEAKGGQDGKGTYDLNEVVVYHLGEIEGPPKDETGYKNDASSFFGGQGLPSIIGNGVALSGPGDKIVIPESASLAFPDGFTFSTWIRMAQSQEDAYLFSREVGERAIIVGIDQTHAYYRIAFGEDQVIVSEKEAADVPLGSWHHIAVTAEPKGRVTLYLDGLPMYYTELPIGLPNLQSDIVVGDSNQGGHAFAGDLDEVRIATVPRSAGWAKACYGNQGPEPTLPAFGLEELSPKGGLPIFYLKTVLKNITLEGWLIIGLLILLAAMSWVIFVSKAIFLWLTGKENHVFLEAFGGLTEVTALKDKEDEFQNSTLFRIYHAGCRNLKGWLGNPGSEAGDKELSLKAMSSFRAELDKGFIDETKRLNSWLVVLTMAISGGPFLGLLGTVWGVMNTFAAMAEAGEANIMAIAPGVASALSTTVFGLIVAIPALFTYNYLTVQIKNLTADTNIFLDQFALRVDEAYGGRA